MNLLDDPSHDGGRKQWLSDFERLQAQGVRLPPPDILDDVEVNEKLWELLGRLAGRGVFLLNTDHLDDRQLYEQLWEDVLREEYPSSNLDDDGGFEGYWLIDMVGTGCEEELRDWLKYYATEGERREWSGRFPEDEFPPHHDPPFDRDRFLPSPTMGRWSQN